MEGKKSFVLYTDQREIFEELTDEQAGKLIKHIFSYVSDENPETDDKYVKLSFIPIKTQLKRDLKIWDEKKQLRSEAGKKGGLAKASNARNDLANPSNARNDLAKLAVNVNGNVNVNDNVNGNVNVNGNEIINIYEVNEETHNQIFRELWNSKIWLEGLALTFKADYKDVQNHLNTFRQECILKADLKETEDLAKKHFFNWVKKGNPIPKNEGKSRNVFADMYDELMKEKENQNKLNQ
jgi:hypothetical protein